MKVILDIEGMSCEHCSARVEKSLRACGGVESVRVDLEGKCAEVVGAALDEAALKEAVESTGYDVTQVRAQ